MGTMGNLFGRVGLDFSATGGMGLFKTAGIILLCTFGLAAAAGFAYWMIRKRRNWNIKVEFRLPRDVREVSDDEGNVWVTGSIKKEWGKGCYDARTGTVFVKRKKTKAVPMEPFDIKKYLSDNNILTVIQVGIEQYTPVLEESYLEIEDESGKEFALLKCKIDTSKSKAWRNTFERESKSTYTLAGWLHEHGQLLGFGFVIFMILVGFAILYSRIG